MKRTVSASAFTLIELLVVVTIIVVLLALLVPAMDKALYQAELASCGANLKGIATATTTYALAFKRHYPYRHLDVAPQKQLSRLRGGEDDRTVMQGYVEMDLFVDPLCEKVNLGLGETHTDSSVFASYSLLFGYYYQPGGVRQQGLRKMGDRLSFTFAGKSQRYTVLALDQDIMLKNGWAHGSHPDADGKLTNYALQDEGDTKRALDPVGVSSPKLTLSWYEVNTTHERGTIELQAVFTDGSVARYDKVTWDAGKPGDEGDERMSGIPEFSDGTNLPCLAGCRWLVADNPAQVEPEKHGPRSENA